MVNYPLFPPQNEDVVGFARAWWHLRQAGAGNGVLIDSNDPNGMKVTRASASSVNVAAGHYANKGTWKAYAGASPAIDSIPAASAGYHRYDSICVKLSDNTIVRVAGTEAVPDNAANFLENFTPLPADLNSTDYIELAILCIDEDGIRSTDNGSYSVGGVCDTRPPFGFGLDDSTLKISADGKLEAQISALLDTISSTEGVAPVRGSSEWEVVMPARGASPYSRWIDDRWLMKAADRDVLVSPANGFEVWINGVRYIKSTSSEYNLAAEATWDTISGTDYRIASNRAGVNFYIYACVPSFGDVPDIKISVNSTNPTGYTTSTSRKIGGFHCVPANMTSLPAGHDFISHVQGDIHCGDGRSGSIWDLLHRPKGIAAPEGMTWCEEANVWVMIYLISGTGVSTASVNGGTISDARNWLDFVDDCGAVGCRLPTDIEFQLFAAGSNEETNIAGSADPGTTGHHLDTAGRSMISNCGCFDCCGVMYQWLSDQSFRIDGLTDPTVDPAWSWEDLPGSKGSLYKQGTYGDSKLLAGGAWLDGSGCGSRGRFALRYRWYAGLAIGARAVAEGI
jgi:hypothetical protein